VLDLALGYVFDLCTNVGSRGIKFLFLMVAVLLETIWMPVGSSTHVLSLSSSRWIFSKSSLIFSSALLLLLPAADENKTNIKFGYTIAITDNVNSKYWALQF